MHLPLDVNGRSEYWLMGVRAVLAFALALAIGFSPYLHLKGLVGTLGMYAVTDGVLSALVLRPARVRYTTAEAVVSIALGLAMMLWTQNERPLLILFCVRNIAVAGAEILFAHASDSGAWFTSRNRHALLTYAALSAIGLSLAYLVAAMFGYGALDLHSCLAGQLGIWSALVFAHVVRLRRRSENEDRPTLPGLNVQPRLRH